MNIVQRAAVTLEDVTADNWEAVADLEVTENESDFVASNAYSLAQSKYEPSARPLAIYAGRVPVGFLMYEIDEDEPGAFMIYRFMVDRRHRGHGYGQVGLRLLVERIQRDPAARVIRVCYVPENVSARRLYASLGFVETDRDDDGELIAERAV